MSVVTIHYHSEPYYFNVSLSIHLLKVLSKVYYQVVRGLPDCGIWLPTPNKILSSTFLHFITLTVFVFTVALHVEPILYCFSTIFTELTQIIITTSNVANTAPANVATRSNQSPPTVLFLIISS